MFLIVATMKKKYLRPRAQQSYRKEKIDAQNQIAQLITSNTVIDSLIGPNYYNVSAKSENVNVVYKWPKSLESLLEILEGHM